MSDLRREQPRYRISAYLILAGMLATAQIIFAIPIGWVAAIYLTVGVTETGVTTAVMVRRARKLR